VLTGLPIDTTLSKEKAAPARSRGEDGAGAGETIVSQSTR